jgi:hypothetical protein
MTYAELVAAIQNYSENSFDYSTTPSIINRFISQAEQTIYNSVQLPSLRKNVNGVTSSGNKFLSCPDDWLATYSMAVVDATGAYTYLLNKDTSFMQMAYPNPSDTGLPLYYALFGPQTSQPAELTFLLAPTPDAVYTMVLNYFFYPQSIVTAGNTWLGDNFDIALLNYCLVEATTYMKGEQDMVALYKSRAENSMVLLKQLGDAKEKGDSFRDPPPKYKVI